MLPLSTYPDEDLVRLLTADNEQAFNQIYHRYWRKLYALAFQRLRSKQAAEDVVQEVLAGVWQRRNSSLISHLESYLAAATRYAVFRQLSKEAAQASAINQTQEKAPVFDEIQDVRLLEQMVQKEVNKLPEKCRLVFQYSRDLGLSNKEIAGSLDISQKAVEKHITKAIRTIRSQLKSLLWFL